MQQMGDKKFLEMLLTGRAFTAKEMEQIGFINKVVPLDKLEQEVNEMASVIAQKPIEILVADKYYVNAIRAMRNDSLAPNIICGLTHCAASYMTTEPDDFVVLKETTRAGLRGMIEKREERYPPAYRLSIRKWK